MSLFITFEGGDGSGKSTQARRLAEWLTGKHFPVTLVREPGSTPIGQHLRQLIKGSSMTPTAELLIFAAARAEMVETVVRPALSQGRVVVADRYADSTRAYQHYGRGIPAETVDCANSAATVSLKPGLTFLLDLAPRLAQERINPRWPSRGRSDDSGQLRFEREPLEFHDRVRAGYLALAAAEPDRWVAIDGSAAEEAVHLEICKATASRLPLRKDLLMEPDLVDLTSETVRR